MKPAALADMLAGFFVAWIIWALFAPYLMPWIQP